MGDGKESAGSLRSGDAGDGESAIAGRRRFFSLLGAAAAASAGLTLGLVSVEAFAAGGNSIATMLSAAVDNVTMCGGGIAILGACGAMGATATGNHGIIGPSLKAAGGGTGIATSAQLVGLVLPGGAAGAALSAPAALSAMDWLHILAAIVS